MTRLLAQLSPPAGSDLECLITAKHENAVHARELVEVLWEDYEPYASKDWRNKFSLQFAASFWEMYLTVGLVREGRTVRTHPYDDGPDITIETAAQPTAIDAVILTPGDPTSADSVPPIEFGKVRDVPRDKIVLRYTQAISVKLKQRERWIRSGVVGVGQPFVIAIAASPLLFTFSDTHPLILKALCPMGDLSIKINRDTLKSTDAFHGYREEIKKANESAVKTLYFATDRYKELSAVVAARFDYMNNPLADIGKFFAGFAVIKNPFASAPVSDSIFVDADEYKILSDGEMMAITRAKPRT